MKNLLRFLGIVALIAIVGLSMISCDSGGGGGGSRTPPEPKPKPEPDPEPATYEWVVEVAPSARENGTITADTGEVIDGQPVKLVQLLYAYGDSTDSTPTAIDKFLEADESDPEDVGDVTEYIVTGSKAATGGALTIAGAYNLYIPAYVVDPIWAGEETSTIELVGDKLADAVNPPVPYVTVTEIAEGAFSADTNLTKLEFAPESRITKIGKNAFNGVTGLDDVVDLPKTITEIGDGAFAGAGTSGNVLFINGANVARIGNGAFTGFGGNLIIVYGIANKELANRKWNDKGDIEDDDENVILTDTSDWMSGMAAKVIVRLLR